MAKSRPLATHLALTHGAIGLLACLATGLLLALLLPRVYLKQRESALVRQGQALASDIALWLSGHREQPGMIFGGPEGAGVIVVDAQQQVVARSVGHGMGGRGWGPPGRGMGMGMGRGMGMMREAEPEIDRVWRSGWKSLSSGQVIQRTVTLSSAQRVFVAAIPAEHDEKMVGAVVLFAHLAEVRGAANALLPLIALASLAVALVAVSAGVWLSGRMARPLRRMTEAARQIARGDLQVTVEPPAWQEGESLALAFNSMTQSLAAEEAARRQFIADASHQLRAPLTSLQAQAEAILDEVVTDEPTRRKFLARMVEETRRLSTLAQELLDLERLDARQAPPRLQEVDIPALVRSVAEAFSAEGLARFELDLPDSLPKALADPEELRQALVNLADNALKHTPASGRVRLSAGAAQDVVTVAVADQGPGIAAEHLPRIWDRFYRVPEDAHEGSGLGLAIVKRLVERQGGSVAVESNPGSGSTFSFSVPLAGEN
jgi:signal transduction histidine kinase